MHKQIWKGSAASAAAGLLAFFGSPALAGGFSVEEQSAKGLGRAYSGEVADGGAASLFWNPAAIARSGRELHLGWAVRLSSSELTDSGSTVTRPIPPAGLTTPVGGQTSAVDPVADNYAPIAALVLPINDRISVGLALSEPFALDTSFEPTSWVRYDSVLAEIDTRSVEFSAALAVSEWLDVGVSAQAQHMDARLHIALPNLSPQLADGLSSVDGEGWQYGWAVGAQAHAGPLTLGASYRSGVSRDLKGTLAVSGLLAPLDAANFSAPSQVRFHTPSSAMVGVRWKATPRLTLNAQVTRYGWDTYDDLAIVAGGQTTLVPQEYSDSKAVALGADFAVGAAWTLRAGVRLDQTPTPTHLREGAVPHSDSVLWAIGASFAPAPAFTIDAALAHHSYEDTQVVHDVVAYGGTPAQTAIRVRGDIRRSATVLSTGVRWRF